MAKLFKRFLLAASILVVAIIVYYGYSFIQFGLGIQDKPEAETPEIQTPQDKDTDKRKPDESEEPALPEWEGSERVNILLLGGDARDVTAGRTDTILVLSVDPVSKQTSLFSLLRDTYVTIPKHGQGRINAATVYGGSKLAMNTVSELTGLPIHYYFYVDFQGFVELVDAIGGVDFHVEKNMKYSSQADGPELDIDLKEGLQHLDGKKALQYVRFRHDARSDYARTERQRNFLQAIAKEMQTTTNLLKLPSILKKIEPYIETNMSLNTMVRLGTLSFKVDTQNVNSLQLPPNHLLREVKLADGSEVITVDPASLQSYVKEKIKPTVAKSSEDIEAAESAESSS